MAPQAAAMRQEPRKERTPRVGFRLVRRTFAGAVFAAERGCPRSLLREGANTNRSEVQGGGGAPSRPPAYGNSMPLIVTVRAPLASQSFNVKMPVATSGGASASTLTPPPNTPGAMGSGGQSAITFSSTPFLP